jgi:hypothetical protein
MGILKKKYDYWWKKYWPEKTDGWLKLRFLTEIGRLHWNQGEEVTHFAWFGEPWLLESNNIKLRGSSEILINMSFYVYIIPKETNIIASIQI